MFYTPVNEVQGEGVYRNHNFFVVWHWLTIFGTWLHHHETMCRAHSWSLYDLKVMCCGRWRLTSRFLTRFRVWPVTIFYLTFSYHIWHMCKSVPYFHDPLYDLWPQYQICIYTMNLSLARLSFALWHLSIHNFGIRVYHHETTCCIHSWPFYDLDLWPIPILMYLE